jgi:excinuclease ABC subunit B
MKRAIGETERRRKLQLEYNKKHNITPKTIQKKIKDILPVPVIPAKAGIQAILELESVPQKGRSAKKIIAEKEAQMKEPSRNLEFELAAILRDEIKILKKKIK